MSSASNNNDITLDNVLDQQRIELAGLNDSILTLDSEFKDREQKLAAERDIIQRNKSLADREMALTEQKLSDLQNSRSNELGTNDPVLASASGKMLISFSLCETLPCVFSELKVIDSKLHNIDANQLKNQLKLKHAIHHHEVQAAKLKHEFETARMYINDKTRSDIDRCVVELGPEIVKIDAAIKKLQTEINKATKQRDVAKGRVEQCRARALKIRDKVKRLNLDDGDSSNPKTRLLGVGVAKLKQDCSTANSMYNNFNKSVTELMASLETLKSNKANVLQRMFSNCSKTEDSFKVSTDLNKADYKAGVERNQRELAMAKQQYENNARAFDEERNSLRRERTKNLGGLTSPERRAITAYDAGVKNYQTGALGAVSRAKLHDNDVERLKKKLTELQLRSNGEKERLSEQLVMYKQELSKHMKVKEQILKRKESLEETLGYMKKLRENDRSEFYKKSNDFVKLMNTLTVTQAELRKTRKDVERYGGIITDISGKYKRCYSTLRDMKDKLNNQSLEKSAAIKALAKLKILHSNLNNTHQNVLDKLESCRGLVEDKSGMVTQLKNDVAKCQAGMESSMVGVANLRSAASSCANNKAMLATELQQCRELHTTLRDAHSDAISHQKGLMRQLQSVAAELENLKDDIRNR